jgi:hypothetical protein
MPRVACPHCNAVVDAPAGRTACPRCAEAFDPGIAEHLPDEAVSAPMPVVRPKGFLHSRAAMALSCGVAALILVVGLAVVRPWEAKPKPGPDKLPVVVSPLGLSGIAYLPPSTNIIAAIQPMPLLAYAAQKKIDPKKFLIESGVPEPIFESLAKAGVTLDQIDHLIVGFALKPDTSMPGVAGCLKLTRPIADETRFLAALRAEKNSQQSKGGRTVYSISFNMSLTSVDDRTYVFGLGEVDLALIEKPHAAGGGHLPKELREAMTARLSPASFAWFATDSDRWIDKPTVKAVGLMPAWKDRVELLKPIRAAAAGLAVDDAPELRLAIRAADAITTNRMRDGLLARVPGDGVEFAGDDEWVALRTPFDPGTPAAKTLLAELRKDQ